MQLQASVAFTTSVVYKDAAAGQLDRLDSCTVTDATGTILTACRRSDAVINTCIVDW